MESQPQNPEFRNNPETWLILHVRDHEKKYIKAHISQGYQQTTLVGRVESEPLD